MSLAKTNDTENSPLDATTALVGEENLSPPPQLSEAAQFPLATPLENTNDTEKSALDATTIFGGEDTLPPPPQLSEAEENKLWRKVDLRLLPILTLLFLVCYIDGGNFFFVWLLGLLKVELIHSKYWYIFFIFTDNVELKRFEKRKCQNTRSGDAT